MKTVKNILGTILIMLFATAILVSLSAGCSKDADINDSTISNFFDTDNYAFLSEVIPLPVFPGVMDNIGSVVFSEGRAYFTAWGHSVESFMPDNHGIFSMNPDGTDLTELSDYVPGLHLPENASGGITIDAMYADNDGNIWILETLVTYGFNYTDYSVMVIKLDKTGNEISSFDLSSLVTDFIWISEPALCVDNNGNVYVAMGTNIYVISSQGKLLFTLKNPGFNTQFIQLSDGTVAFVEWMNNSYHLKVIDVGNETWGEIIRIPSQLLSTQSIFPGVDEFLYFYNCNHYLNGINAQSGETVQLFNWSESSLAPDNIIGIMFLIDGNFAAIRQSQFTSGFVSDEKTTELLLLKKTPLDELPEKIVLTFGVSYYDREQSYAVELFNRNSRTHKIEVIDYSQFNTDGDWNAGTLRLITEIITGNSPDILDIWMIPDSILVSQGVLADLYPLIDTDPELNRSDFIERLIKLIEVDGSLYRIPTGFSIDTIIGNPAVLGSYPGWTVGEFIDVINANPNADMLAGQITNNIWFLSMILESRKDAFIDRSTGTVDFENDEFIKLLETAKIFPSEQDWDTIYNPQELIATGRQIMQIGNIGSFEILLSFKAWFGGEIIFKGHPAENREGNSVYLHSNKAISANCKDVDAAWEFLRIFFSEDYQRKMNTWTFPVNNTIFEEKLEDAMKPTGIFTYTAEDKRVSIDPLSPKDILMIKEVVNNINQIKSIDDVVWNIINESATDYFNGIITAEDAARIIQNRVSIYISEQS